MKPKSIEKNNRGLLMGKNDRNNFKAKRTATLLLLNILDYFLVSNEYNIEASREGKIKRSEQKWKGVKVRDYAERGKISNVPP